MSDIAFRMMMDSGVLRPGEREIRRNLYGNSPFGTREVLDRLNHSVEVLFGPELAPNKLSMTKAVSRPSFDKPTPSPPASSHISLKRILIGLGWLNETNEGPGSEPPSPPLQVTRLKTQMQKLQLRLKTEQALCQVQREELTKLRAQVNRIEVLEAHLETERESGARLAQWLEEAEQELADLRGVLYGVGQNGR